MAGDRKRKITVSKRLFTVTRVIKADQIVPVPRQPATATAFAVTEHVDRHGFLPESALGNHDRQVGRRKDDFRHQISHVAFNRAFQAGFAGRASAEFHLHFRLYETGVLKHRFVGNVNLIILGAESRSMKTGANKLFLYQHPRVFSRPLLKTLADRLGPLLFLTAVGRKRVLRVTNDIRRKSANIVGYVKILGKTPDRIIGL